MRLIFAAIFISATLFQHDIYPMDKKTKDTEAIPVTVEQLHQAIIKQDAQEVERLLKSGVDPNVDCYSTNQKFKEMAKSRNLKFEKAIIPTVLLATSKNNLKIVKLLCEYKADYNRLFSIKTKTGIVYSFTKYSFVPEKKKEDNSLYKITPLFLALLREYEEIANYLLQKDAKTY